MGAVSHEIRNVCGAIAVIYENLVRSGALTGTKDFEALGSLVETLNKIASLELKQSASDSEIGGIDLRETLDDLKIVLEPYCQEADIAVHWDIPAELPAVWADRHSLLQVLLNLTKNSERALEGAGLKRIDIAVTGRQWRGIHPGYGFGTGHRFRRQALSTLPEGGRFHGARPLSLARFCAILSG